MISEVVSDLMEKDKIPIPEYYDLSPDQTLHHPIWNN